MSKLVVDVKLTVDKKAAQDMLVCTGYGDKNRNDEELVKDVLSVLEPYGVTCEVGKSENSHLRSSERRSCIYLSVDDLAAILENYIEDVEVEYSEDDGIEVYNSDNYFYSGEIVGFLSDYYGVAVDAFHSDHAEGVWVELKEGVYSE